MLDKTFEQTQQLITKQCLEIAFGGLKMVTIVCTCVSLAL